MKTKTGKWFLIAAVVAGVTILVSCGYVAWAQEGEGPASSVRFVVVRDTDGKPIKYAQVVVHSVNRKGKASKEEMELKTDAEGQASVDGIPYGSVEVQVLAKGFQTFGEDYEVNKPQVEITVKLKRPAGQYSTYENHEDKKAPEQKPQ
ncbi:MAG: carboxypeptidase-like regulatory domain-containing protein [Terriglobales bacterium]|jgi:hypothetical protein